MNSSNFTVVMVLVAAMLLVICEAMAQQIDIPRIELMPNMPQPYDMRNWKQVAIGYDSLVFNLNAQGEFLPLIFWRQNLVNYPNHPSFGLHTVVGTTAPSSGEAINVIPAVIGASLVGIDKSNQNGQNWVLMCEEFFNRRPAENVYLNHPVAQSGDDWWYATMPNVFFYQLYDLYPNTGDFAFQFASVADRWLEAVQKMGGSATPWHVPNMNYRGWYLSTMRPYVGGVLEPEAAGAIAWLLYNAFVETGEVKYRIGAEWAMEFLNSLSANPSYELQLPYGAYIAARMNAELGTNYDIENLVNWCFNVGPLRQWGAIAGNWGGYDVHGLIGESAGNDYAFAMNTFEHIGALVPFVRYDERFARALGKWVLNAANAARLFYPKYLPDQNQDSEEWAHQYDPNSYIAHEALRESAFGASPFATGDAISGGWGRTNLALYGSSHAGILGGIIDTTDVEGILKLDLLKNDYFHGPAYPTYLYFNPHGEDKVVEIEIGDEPKDLYDALQEYFVARNVSGKASFSIIADYPAVISVTPAGGAITHELHKTLINGVVVDYRNNLDIANHPPRIKALAARRITIALGQTETIYCTAVDLDPDQLAFEWTALAGEITGQGASVEWKAPDVIGQYSIACRVSDGVNGVDSAVVQIKVAETVNQPPVITSLKARPKKIDLGGTTTLTCDTRDPDSDTTFFQWSTEFGRIDGLGRAVAWTAPNIEGDYRIACRIADEQGGEDVDTVTVRVRDFSQTQSGDLVAYYPFNGNANDESGLGNHGVVSGATLVSDRFGRPNSAYYFDGSNDYVRVPSSASLNFQNAITVSLWMRVDAFFDREAYPLSHGNWENRWKLSITDGGIRWTIKTDAATNSGIKDLDSETKFQRDTWYHIAALYDGADFEVYVNGEPDEFSSWSGKLLTTSIDLTIGQVLPNNSNYNFRGVIDDIRIYNYALTVPEIKMLYEIETRVGEPQRETTFKGNQLFQCHPNPFNATTTIPFRLEHAGRVTIAVYDLIGKRVRILVDGWLAAGEHRVTWEGDDDAQRLAASGVYVYEMRAAEFIQRRKLLMLK